MIEVSDVFLWRAVFLLVMLAALFLGVGAWQVAAWVARRMQSSSERKRFAGSVLLRRLRA